MKKELTEKRFKRLLINLRTTRVRLLRGSLDQETIRGLKKLRRTLWRTGREWNIDGHTKDILQRFIKIIEDDIKIILPVINS